MKIRITKQKSCTYLNNWKDIIIKLESIKDIQELIDTINMAQNEGVWNDTNEKILRVLQKGDKK